MEILCDSANNKVKNPTLPSDYRPISLICTLDKIFEKIISHQIHGFLEMNTLLIPTKLVSYITTVLSRSP